MMKVVICKNGSSLIVENEGGENMVKLAIYSNSETPVDGELNISVDRAELNRAIKFVMGDDLKEPKVDEKESENLKSVKLTNEVFADAAQ